MRKDLITGGIEINQDEIEQLLIDAVTAKYPELAQDRHALIVFGIFGGEGLSADVSFVSYN